MIEESKPPGTSAAELARRHGMSANRVHSCDGCDGGIHLQNFSQRAAASVASASRTVILVGNRVIQIGNVRLAPDLDPS